MKALFIELPAFERHRDDYFDDEGFVRLQLALMVRSEAGDLIEGTEGFGNCDLVMPVEVRASAAGCE